MISDFYIHKTDLPDLSSFISFFFRFSRQILKYVLLLESGNLQLEQPNSLCFGKISKFPVFSLTGILLLLPFSMFFLFSLCSGYPETTTSYFVPFRFSTSFTLEKTSIFWVFMGLTWIAFLYVHVFKEGMWTSEYGGGYCQLFPK